MIYRFAGLAVLTGAFSPVHAGMTFVLLALGGLVVGAGWAGCGSGCWGACRTAYSVLP
ncbi:hypothetical protein RAA17_11270 [Komagataeibacter rhaeticus]|nr:hypothetical protein [Komagataeibacter rhaeticus]